jgi:uncharacterized membrane protein YqiK
MVKRWHLRSIVGSMTVEEMIRARDKLTTSTRESSSFEMQKLGLTIDSLQIQEIDDKTGYIANIGAPEAARVAKEARIAQAEADREATQREQEAKALKAAARSQSEIHQAGNIGNLTVLNGAEGMGQLFNQVLGMGASAIPLLREMLQQPNGDAASAGTSRQVVEKAEDA